MGEHAAKKFGQLVAGNCNTRDHSHVHAHTHTYKYTHACIFLAQEYDAGEDAAKKYGRLVAGNRNSFVVLPLSPGHHAEGT